MLFQHGYILLGELGRGGQACVYLVQRRGQAEGEYEACKIGKQERLREEAYLLRSLQHPCFPRYYAYWQWENLGVLVMEYIGGRTLEEWLCERQISLPLVENWCRSLGEALEYLHNMPEVWIYRDLKPANVVIREDGKLKLVDMGCACPLSRVAESMAGTPEYCAPEQLRAPEAVGPYSDYYSLGKIIEQLLEHSGPQGLGEYLRYFKWKRFCKKCLRLEIGKREKVNRAIFEQCVKCPLNRKKCRDDL